MLDSKKFHAFIRQLYLDYLHNTHRKVEFASYFVFYILLTTLLSFSPQQYRGLVAAFQSFVLFFLAFRFVYLGIIAGFLFIVYDYVSILHQFIQTHNVEYYIAFSTKTFTLVATVMIAIMTHKKDIHQNKLQLLAITDELTGLYNQRYFHATLNEMMNISEKEHRSVGLIMMDIDDFKRINDVYGHDCGDLVLKGTGALLQTIVPKDQIVCRCGGDEFAIILTDTDLHRLEASAQRIKETFESIKGDYYPSNIAEKVTISMGLSQFPDVSSSKSELTSQADMALYHAKNLGKDRIHFYQDVILQIRRGVTLDHQQLIGAFKTLLSTMATKDKYTLIHSERVSTYAVIIGQSLDLNPTELSILQYAGLLHDIGKIEIPKSILNKVKPLTEEEYYIIRQHPVYSENILEPLQDIDNLLDYVRHHHERMDGRGYPDGLSGDRLSLGARILCVADSFDAMISERPYKRHMTPTEAFDELQRRTGSQFDPHIVQALIRSFGQAANSSSLIS